MPDIGLQIQAERHFGFLVAERCYQCSKATPYLVRFQSPTTFIELVYDGDRSFELGLLIGKTGLKISGDPPFTIDEILRLRRAPEAKKFSLIQVTSREALASFVEQLAEMLQTYGGDFISGNEKSFAELAQQRQMEIKTYALERDLRMARLAVEAAWREKDYEAVIKILKPLRAALTATEIGKLEFAETRLKR